MRESLNFNTLFNTIAMVRSEISKLMVVVEGDDDFHLLTYHRSDDIVLMPGQGGKPHVLAAAALSAQQSVTGVLFLVDRDYDNYTLTTDPYPPNVISSKRHDFFADIVESGTHVMDALISTHTRSSRRSGSDLNPGTIRLEAINLAAQLAPFRIVNEKLDLGLNFRNFPFGNLVTINPSPIQLAEMIVNRSNTTWTADQLHTLVTSETAELGDDLMDLVGDHDFFRALSRVLANYGVKKETPEGLLNSFLTNLISNCGPLIATDWHRKVNEWAAEFDSSVTSCPCGAAA